jgi:putative tricarboxylic transport membrane protein
MWLRQDFVGGLVVIAVALFAFWQATDLPIGTLGGMGPGMLPKSLAVLFGLLGAALVLDSFLETSLPLEP